MADDAVRAAGEIDVLMVPVDDSRHLLSFDEVDEVIRAFSPRAVIPMHYYIPGLTRESSTLKGIDEWLESLKGVPVRRLGTSVLELRPGDLPGRDSREVWVMDADIR